ncbi:PREDICTED: uncharacterized protein LOC104768873 [Camelina sativa]|uniref:Uncharacterized protein LOC104768873 n=1 Tax=Camelina sativa TaxID=90675 RepID=A0ABM0XUL9_CAMSA|nr:PREDICTED: uncharacterized protein LOC104768873 [Camelina sativa]
MERTYDLFGAPDTELVEFYPTSIRNSSELRNRGKSVGEIKITGVPFTRIVFHPNQGTDILLDQFVDVERRPAYVRSLTLPRSAMASSQALSQFVLANPPPSSERRLNWGWNTIAAGIADCVDNSQHVVMSPDDIMELHGQEAFGKVYFLKESDGWESPLGINEDIDDVCYLCPDHYYFYTHAACDPTSPFIRLACAHGHGYHKRCILPYLWRMKPAKIPCPSCMMQL